MVKNLSKVGIEGKFYNTIDEIHEKPNASTILNGERLETFPLRSGTVRGFALLPLLFNIALKVLARAIIRKRK